MDIEVIKTVLIAYDFSPCADRALAMGITIAGRFNAEALIVNVINRRDIEAIEHAMHRSILADTPTTSDDMVREFKEERLQELQKALVKYSGKGHRFKPHVSVGEPVDEILAIGREHSADLIVMGARGHSRMTRLLTGSKAEALFRLSSTPILSVRREEDF